MVPKEQLLVVSAVSKTY